MSETVEVKVQGALREDTRTYESSFFPEPPILARLIEFAEREYSNGHGEGAIVWKATVAVLCMADTGEYREVGIDWIREHRP